VQGPPREYSLNQTNLPRCVRQLIIWGRITDIWVSNDYSENVTSIHTISCVGSLYQVLSVPVCETRRFILIRSNEMQQYAGIYLLQNHSTCFGCPSSPSSGVYNTLTAVFGAGHNIWTTTFLQRGQNWPRWGKVFAQILWTVPEAAVTVLCTHDWRDGHPICLEWFCSK
jgi:hypothetical protein